MNSSVLVKIVNDFHGTSARVAVPCNWTDEPLAWLDEYAKHDRNARRRRARLIRKLCPHGGSPACACVNRRYE